jgi:hypothetical protein
MAAKKKASKKKTEIKVGRPTKYSDALLAKANEYLEKYDVLTNDVMPSHIGLFLYLGISRACGYDWANDERKKEFSDILEKCNMIQQQVLLNNGLNGTFNSNITKLALGKHGYTEKQEVTGQTTTVLISENDAGIL